MKKILLALGRFSLGLGAGLGACSSFAQSSGDLGALSRLSTATSRSISAENFTGGKGQGGQSTDGLGSYSGRELGQGWKMSPRISVAPGQTATLALIAGPGTIKHIWMTPAGNWRYSILRMYWDDEPTPSVESPVGDFFGQGWGSYAPIASLPVCVNPRQGFNCYWDMPFRKAAKLTIQNLDGKPLSLYYQIDYELDAVPANSAYLHAQFRRVKSIPFKTVYTILDGVKGQGQYVGTYLAWGSHSTGWWGEGEIKFYLDGDRDFPTICGTGTEDYFCGSHDFENAKTHEYEVFTSPYSGLAQVIKPDGLYSSQQRFGMYRWHIRDPIHFKTDLRVTIQDLGWHQDHRYQPLQDDIASVAFWYQAEPHAPFPPLPERDILETGYEDEK